MKNKFLHIPFLLTALLFLWRPDSWGDCSSSVMLGTTYCLDIGYFSPSGGESSSLSYRIASSDMSPSIQAFVIDNDGDGYFSNEDCDDNDPEVNPGVAEIVKNGKDDDCNPATPVATVSGFGYNYPAPSFRASLSLDVNASSLGTSWLKYSYQRMYFVSTSMTGISTSGGTATVTGVGKVNNIVGCNFTAMVIDSSPDAMGIVITPSGACTTSYSAGSQAISSGNYSVIGE